MVNKLSINDTVLKFAAANRNAVNRDFYYDDTIRRCWVGTGLAHKDVTRRIGYAIGSLKKKGFLKTVTRGPPAYYDITPAGYAYLEKIGQLPEPADMAALFEDEAKPESSAPTDLPNIIGRIEEVGLKHIKVNIKSCSVALVASGAVAGFILANDLLRKRCKIWIVANEVKWIEEQHDYTER